MCVWRIVALGRLDEVGAASVKAAGLVVVGGVVFAENSLPIA